MEAAFADGTIPRSDLALASTPLAMVITMNAIAIPMIDRAVIPKS